MIYFLQVSMYLQYVSLWTCFMKKIGNSRKTVQYETNNVENREHDYLGNFCYLNSKFYMNLCKHSGRVCSDFGWNLIGNFRKKKRYEKITEILNTYPHVLYIDIFFFLLGSIYLQYVSLWICFMKKKIGNSHKTVQYK